MFGREFFKKRLWIGFLLDIEKNVRGFEHSESSRHLYNQIEKSDIDSLVKTATQNYDDICHKQS